jgi:DNA-binding CsgD family transcriptional regulator
VERIVADLRALHGLPRMTVPGIAFHLACRQRDLPLAETLLDELLAAIAVQGWHGPDLAHDLISASLYAGLPLDRIRTLADALIWSDMWEPWRLIVEAQLAEASGSTGEALAAYRTVAASELLPPEVRATAETGAARCLLAQGHEAAAIKHIETASSLLAKWSGWRVTEVDSLRARIGMAPTGQPTGAPDLTPREREVALLISDGLTNAEIARRLYISPKTAAVHVSSILHKLGVTSRTDVAARVSP